MAVAYNVIVVGARCAGASVATHLARAGAKVLLLDASKLPSDLVLSTHYVQPPGMDALDDLGIGDRVRAASPPTHTFGVQAENTMFLASYEKGRAGHCLRRFKLDTWLQEAATSAGVELRDRSRVEDLVREGDRVVGVVVETPQDRETIRADFVVGADGPHSTVAKLTGVEEYLDFELTRGCYWAYWPAPPSWKSGERPYDMHFVFTGEDQRVVFPADDDLLLLIASPPRAVARSWGRDHHDKYVEYFRSSPLFAPLVENNAPIGKVAGIVAARGFYRRPVGPGFALVGDAGTFKDWVTGHGITDALLGAKRLARAIIDGRDVAYAHYWRNATPSHCRSISTRSASATWASTTPSRASCSKSCVLRQKLPHGSSS